jgi:MFS family permease
MIKHRDSLENNVRIYSWTKLFTKRVYVPLTTIYLVEVGHLKLAQIGVLVTLSALGSILADIPSGHYADRFTRKASLIIGGYLVALESFILVLSPNFVGAIAASLASSIGYSFISGAGEALMHDTLAVLGRVEDYVRVVGRAQSFGLVGNIILVSLVPLTYVIDKRIPFICGTIAALCFVIITGTMVEPVRERTIHHATGLRGIGINLRTFINRRTVMMFAAIGLMSAFYTVYANFNNLVIKDLGLTPSLIGLLFGGSSIVGAVGGLFIHRLRGVSLLRYGLFDVALGTGTLLAIGLTHNLIIGIIFFILNLGFWRLRNILYQDKLLRMLGNAGNKATLVSTLSFFDNINETWLPYVFVAATVPLGFYKGYTVLGLGAFIILTGFYILGVTRLARHQVRNH